MCFNLNCDLMKIVIFKHWLIQFVLCLNKMYTIDFFSPSVLFTKKSSKNQNSLQERVSVFRTVPFCFILTEYKVCPERHGRTSLTYLHCTDVNQKEHICMFEGCQPSLPLQRQCPTSQMIFKTGLGNYCQTGLY